MNTIIDRCMLLIFCIPCALLTVSSDYDYLIIALFSAVAVSAFCDAVTDQRCRAGLLIFYSVCMIFLPELLLFLPMITYDCASLYFLPGAASSESAPGHTRKAVPGDVDGEAYRRLSLVRFLPTVCIAAAVLSQYSRGFRAILDFGAVFLLTGCLAAVLLCFRTVRYETLSKKYLRTRDDDTELRLALEERNHALQAQQNSEIYNATLRERNRIAREIHDNVGHMLTRAILMVGAIKTVSKEESLKEPFCQLEDTLKQAMDSIRKSVHDLRDSSVNLEESLRMLTSEFSFCPVTLTCDISPDIPREVKYSFISVVKEALVNISRHSNASQARITVMEHPGFYQLIIQDNGKNSRSHPVSGAEGEWLSDGMGLQNMRSRVNALNGNIQITDTDGFRIYITVPRKSE